MTKFNPSQKLLFPPEYLLVSDPLEKYEILFSHLNLSVFQENTSCKIGRPQISRQAMIRALIYKNLKGLVYLSDLVADLSEHPNMAFRCGFDPLKPLPSVERVSSFLRDTPTEILQAIRKSLVSQLIELGEIKGKYLAIDSTPIKANVRENNLKTAIKDRFIKNKIPRGDPDSRLGVMVHYSDPFKKRIQYFWGYKNHALSDALAELPIAELTKPANLHDSQLAIPLLKEVKEETGLCPKGVLGDSAHDSQTILEFIIKELKARPFIARNPRRGANFQFEVASSGARICMAGFEMIYWGKFQDRGKTRLKFVCPIIHSKKFAKQIPFCPWQHPKFLEGKGCTAYLLAEKDLRQSIDYGSEQFKKIYNLRTGSERIFSRLLSICMQNPSVKGLKATANHVTLAHITVLLVALIAVKSGNKDKIRFVKTFLKNLVL